MKALLWLTAAAALSEPAIAGPLEQWNAPIAEASLRFGIPTEWIRRVIQAESGGRTHHHGRPVVSWAGAMGLMQLMPDTWREMRVAHNLGADPHQPRDNILAGTAYLRRMYDRFGYPGLFAAYNAGPARYARHLASGRPLPRETSIYLVRTAGDGISTSRNPPGRSKRALFAIATAQPVSLKLKPTVVPRSSGLFVALQTNATPQEGPSPALGQGAHRSETTGAGSERDLAGEGERPD